MRDESVPQYIRAMPYRKLAENAQSRAKALLPRAMHDRDRQ